MNNKGFMRTLEAIVAILIIFGFILFIFPKTERFEGYMPIELDRMSTAMMTEIQNEDSFRKAVLSPEQLIEYRVQQGTDNYESKLGYLIIDEFIKSSLPPLSPWNYAFIICDLDGNVCEGYNPTNPNVLISRDEFQQKLPVDKSIFTKRLFVSVNDVTALPLEPRGVVVSGYKEFKIYFWQK